MSTAKPGAFPTDAPAAGEDGDVVILTRRHARAGTAPAASPEARPLGKRIKQLRMKAGLKMTDLAQATGLAQSTISKVESGAMSPTYDVLQKLAIGLGIDVARLFDDPPPQPAHGLRSVTKHGSGKKHVTPVYAHEVLCSDIHGKRMSPFITKILAHSLKEFPHLISHEGEEFFYVLDGEVMVYTDLYEPLKLTAGDSMYFDTSMGHATVSTGDKDATVLWVHCM